MNARIAGLRSTQEIEAIGDTIRAKIVSKCSDLISDVERETLWLHLFTKCVPVADVEFSQDPFLITNDLHAPVCMPVISSKTITVQASDGRTVDEPLYTTLIFKTGKPDRCVKFKQLTNKLTVFQLLSTIDRKLVECVVSVKFVALFSKYADYCIFLTCNQADADETKTPVKQPLLKELPVSESKVPMKRKYSNKKSQKIDCISITTSDEDGGSVSSTTSSPSLSLRANNRKKIATRYSKRISNDNKKSDLLLEYQGIYQQISISIKDYTCLQSETYLNDIIIDFCIDNFLKNSVPKDRLDKIHVFSSFFYFRLTKSLQNDLNRNKKLNISGDEQKYHHVKNWTKKVNIFEKDYLIIPINIQSHWLLALVCFPGLDGCQNIETNEPYDLKKESQLIADFKQIYEKERKETKVSATDYEKLFSQRKALIKRPCILFFDSMPRLVKKMKISATIRSYLKYEYSTKYETEKTFTVESMPGCAVYVPRQSNSYDCGLYVVTYVEKFFAQPFDDYRIPIVGMKKWFDKEEIVKKREDIANLIIDEIKKHDENVLKMLPAIDLPTQDGKLRTENRKLSADISNLI